MIMIRTLLQRGLAMKERFFAATKPLRWLQLSGAVSWRFDRRLPASDRWPPGNNPCNYAWGLPRNCDGPQCCFRNAEGLDCAH